MIFEVHITGGESILKGCASLGIKAISVDLLRPDRSVIRAEHMTSHVIKIDTSAIGAPAWASLEEAELAINFADSLAARLATYSAVVRTKVECPVSENLLHIAKYVECHFSESLELYGLCFADYPIPLARNQRKQYAVATAREYDRTKFSQFINDCKQLPKAEVELCVYDTFVEEDADWFKEYA